MSTGSQNKEPVFEPEPDTAQSLRMDQNGGDPRVGLALELLRGMAESLAHVQTLLQGQVDREQLRELSKRAERSADVRDVSGCRIVEGVFDGQGMIGADGKSYHVPPNYASKSRLVEGDVMKLTIKPDGTHIFKQVGPVQRERRTGQLAFDASTSDYVVVCDRATYKVLRASVTYFQGEPGDEAVVLVPESGESVWAAVEHVIRH